jgi:hypothetical protein
MPSTPTRPRTAESFWPAGHCLVEGDITEYTAKAVVGESEKWPVGLRTFWIEVEERVRGWAKELEEDVDTPDLWAELQREREVLTGARYEDVETRRSLRTSRRRLRSISDRRRST